MPTFPPLQNTSKHSNVCLSAQPPVCTAYSFQEDRRLPKADWLPKQVSSSSRGLNAESHHSRTAMELGQQHTGALTCLKQFERFFLTNLSWQNQNTFNCDQLQWLASYALWEIYYIKCIANCNSNSVPLLVRWKPMLGQNLWTACTDAKGVSLHR